MPSEAREAGAPARVQTSLMTSAIPKWVLACGAVPWDVSSTASSPVDQCERDVALGMNDQRPDIRGGRIRGRPHRPEAAAASTAPTAW